MAERVEQIAMLVSTLGDQADNALSRINADLRQELEPRIAKYKAEPASAEQINEILADFQRYFDSALSQLLDASQPKSETVTTGGAQTSAPNEGPDLALHVEEEGFEVDLQPTRKFGKHKSTGRLEIDLNRLHPYQVANAIKDDLPSTIAIVMRSLATEHGAKTIELLPEDIRNEVVLALTQQADVSRYVIERVLDTTIRCASRIEQRSESGDAIEQMAALMRSIPKNVRVAMMEKLIAEDEEFGKTLKSQMYCFEDLERLDNRDLQQLLAQCETDNLVFALQGANPELTAKILQNMSKRAKETILEEMEFKAGAKQDEIDGARATLVQVLIQLDESGAISLD